MKIEIALSFLFFHLLKFCFNYFVYPLDVHDKYDKIQNLLLFNSTYTTIYMGTPPQKVNFYLNLSHNKMYAREDDCINENLYNFSIRSKTLFYHYNFDAETFEDLFKKVLLVESLYFYDKVNLTHMREIEDYYLYCNANFTEELSYICGEMGLSILQYEKDDEEMDENDFFIKNVRSENKYFSFYNLNNTDFLISGLYKEFKDVYTDIENISWVNPLVRDNLLHWEIPMKEVFYNDIHMKKSIVFELNPLFELIVGTKEYEKNIQKDFFKPYIDNNICSIKHRKEYNVYECYENKFGIKDIKKFPTLYMYNHNMDHVFNMTGKELFIKIKNIYYFKIVFPVTKIETNRWIIGKIFFRKYAVIFGPSSRLIGFCIIPNKGIIDEEKEKEDIEKNININRNPFSNNMYLNIFIIIIAVLFTLLGLYIGKRLFFSRKKKINELVDDYYQYDSEDDKSVKKDVNEDKKEYTSIEMNSKLEKK